MLDKPSPSKRWSIIIGVNEYQDQNISPLRCCVSDARKTYELLINPKIGCYDAQNTRLLCDGALNPLYEPSITNIMSLIVAFSRQADSEDALLVYFAGHGCEENENWYLLPMDVHLELLNETAISLHWLRDSLSESKAKTKIIILDACHSGVRLDREIRGTMTETFAREIEKMPEGWARLSSCKINERSYEWPEENHGAFTYFLLKGLNKEGDANADGFVTISEIYDYLNDQVPKWASKRNLKQHPTLYYKGAGQIILLPDPARADQIPKAMVTTRMGKLGPERVLDVESVYDPKKPAGHLSIGAESTKVSEVLDIQLIPFLTGRILSHPRNQIFPLRFYIPKAIDPAKDGKVSRIFVMVNGLGESTTDLYDEIALELANHEQKIASVLLPLPNHYCRHVEFKEYKSDPYYPADRKEARRITQSILQDLVKDPIGLVHGYRQVLSDAEKLIETILEPPSDEEFYRAYFHRETRISLFGYSLGGFVVLALLLKDPSIYTSCILLESGASLPDVDGSSLFVRREAIAELLWNDLVNRVKLGTPIEEIDPEDFFCRTERDSLERWARLVGEIKAGKSIDYIENGPDIFMRSGYASAGLWDWIITNLCGQFSRINGLTTVEKDIFDRILFGNNQHLFKQELKQVCNKLLLLLGGIDELFTARSIHRFAPKDTGLAILQIPQIGHWLKYRYWEKWETWKQFVVNTIINFPGPPA